MWKQMGSKSQKARKAPKYRYLNKTKSKKGTWKE